MSNSTSMDTPTPSSTPAPQSTSSSGPNANDSTSSAPAPGTTSSSLLTTSSSSSSVPDTTSSTTSSIPTTSSSISTTSSTPSTSSSQSVSTSVIVETPTTIPQTTPGLTITSTPDPTTSDTRSSTSSSITSSGTAGLQSGGTSKGSSGLNSQGTIAVAVVVPIVAVALIVLAALYFWRKRKARKDAEELRRKEVEEYGYNPNNDPTLPPAGVVGGAANDGAYEMREDGSSGYRGWGTTAVGSSGRKASTTMSGPSAGGIGMAYSEGSPTNGPVSDTRSDNPLTDGRPTSGEIEPLGAMGPATSGNRNGDINRGPSNASSSYSAANRSEESGDGVGNQFYNNQYETENPYSGEGQYGSSPGQTAEMSGQPIIRDVQARRNTRIENPSHFPQQSAGISQNF